MDFLVGHGFLLDHSPTARDHIRKANLESGEGKGCGKPPWLLASGCPGGWMDGQTPWHRGDLLMEITLDGSL